MGSFTVLGSTEGSSIPPMGKGLPARSSVRSPSPPSHLRCFLSSHNKVAPPPPQSPGQELYRFFKKCGVEEGQGRPGTPSPEPGHRSFFSPVSSITSSTLSRDRGSVHTPWMKQWGPEVTSNHKTLYTEACCKIWRYGADLRLTPPLASFPVLGGIIMPTIAVVGAVVVATAVAMSPHPDPNHMPKLKPSTLTEAGRAIHPTLFTYGN